MPSRWGSESTAANDLSSASKRKPFCDQEKIASGWVRTSRQCIDRVNTGPSKQSISQSWMASVLFLSPVAAAEKLDVPLDFGWSSASALHELVCFHQRLQPLRAAAAWKATFSADC